jgi:hypothetical protein
MVSIDTLVSIGATCAHSLEKCVTKWDTLILISANRYESPIAHSRGAAHPRVMECYEGSTAMNNELSRVVNVVATASLIENWINV